MSSNVAPLYAGGRKSTASSSFFGTGFKKRWMQRVASWCGGNRETTHTILLYGLMTVMHNLHGHPSQSSCYWNKCFWLLGHHRKSQTSKTAHGMYSTENVSRISPLYVHTFQFDPHCLCSLHQFTKIHKVVFCGACLPLCQQQEHPVTLNTEVFMNSFHTTQLMRKEHLTNWLVQ